MHEELFGRAGFAGPAAMLYHAEFPNEVVRIEGPLQPTWMDVRDAATPDLEDARGDFVPVCGNAEVMVGFSRRSQPMPYCYRNAAGDLLYFVHTGTGTFATEFGPIAYEPGDYVYLPKGTTFRHLPDGPGGLFYVIESPEPIRLADHTSLGRHMPFDPSLLTVPEVTRYDWPARNEWELRIKGLGTYTSVYYANCPMDLIGWKGDLFPFKLNIRDIIPISSDRIHVAPSAWATFESNGFMVVTFVPQIAVADMTAEELPSNHRNIDCDEIAFIHAGELMPVGKFVHMPQGYMHGVTREQREAFNRMRTPNMRRTLTGVSVDTYRPAQMVAPFDALAKR